MNYTSETAQRMMVVMAALSEMKRPATKHETLSYIQSHGYLDIQPDDLKSYETHSEPKWHTDIAWARQACVAEEREWMFRSDDNDYWALTRLGREKYETFAAKFQNGGWDVSRCILWSATFKKKLYPAYDDTQRPFNVLDEYV